MKNHSLSVLENRWRILSDTMTTVPHKNFLDGLEFFETWIDDNIDLELMVESKIRDGVWRPSNDAAYEAAGGVHATIL